MSKNQIFNPLRDELLATCLTRVENGEVNNTLETERLRGNPALARQVIGTLATVVAAYEPALILSVPDRGDWLAEAVSLETGVDFGLLREVDSGEFDCLPDSREQVDSSDSIIVMDSVLDTLSSARKIMAIAGVETKTQAVVGVFDRGSADRASIGVPVESILRRPIPDHLPQDDKLWRLVDNG